MSSDPQESYWVQWASSFPRDQRRGQWAYNLLSDIRPDLALRVNAVVGLDPFYDDTNLPAFELWLFDHWTDVLDGDG